MNRLKYEKYNNLDNVLMIDLHNGYSVIVLINFDREKQVYNSTLFLKANTVDDWKLIEKAENLEFNSPRNTIKSIILKHIATLLEQGFFDYYIERYEYELRCFDRGNKLFEEERLECNGL